MKSNRTFPCDLCLGFLLAFWPCLKTQAQISIQSYDTPSYIDFESTEISVSSDATNVVLHLFRTGEFRDSSKIDFETLALEDSEPGAFAATGGTLVFQPGEGYKTLLVPIRSRSDSQPASFRIRLSSSTTNNIIVRDTAVVTIENIAANSAPALQISPSGDGSIQVSWSSTPTHYILESSPMCAQFWAPVAETPALIDGKNRVTCVPNDASAIFRLRAD